MILKLKRTPAIYLVGFMGCGKSTVGRALADELGWTFVDLDEEIERREGVQHRAKFSTRAEKPRFGKSKRAALHERVRTVQIGRPQVISLGGGAFLADENFELAIQQWRDDLARLRFFDHRPPGRRHESPPAGARSGAARSPFRRAPRRLCAR